MTLLTWEIDAATDRGCLRKDNQDNYYISPDHRVFVVADGMGGERGGALASQLAVEAVEEYFWQEIPNYAEPEVIQQWLMEAVSRANMAVYAERVSNPDVSRLGTTIVIAVQSENSRLFIAHLGDSRAYRISASEISVLTQDHSVAFELVLRGQLAPEQYEKSPFRSYLTRCVGHDAEVSIDQSPAVVEPGDWILLCTDGLTGVVGEAQIADTLRQAESTEKACQSLVEQTIAGGAPDNVTVVCVRYAEKKVNVVEAMASSPASS